MATFQLSYLHLKNVENDNKYINVQVSSIYWIDTGLIILNALGFQLGAYLMGSYNMNPKLIIAIGGGTALAGYIMCSYCVSVVPFFISYGILTGIG